MAQREIKFRAWNSRNKRVYLDHMMFDDQGLGHPVSVQRVYSPNTGYDFDEVDVTDDVILEQYFGMYDEEDIGIYNGDIIKVWDNGIGQVVYENGVFKVDFKDGRKYPLELWWQDFVSGEAPDNPFKVLGNIHEQPDFVKWEAE